MRLRSGHVINSPSQQLLPVAENDQRIMQPRENKRESSDDNTDATASPIPNALSEEGKSTDQEMDHESAPKSTKTSDMKWKCMALSGLKASAVVLVVMFVVCPTVLKLFPCIYTEIVFLQRLRWPPFKVISSPTNCGANFTRNLRINSTDGVSLGAWHMLPADLHHEAISTTVEFESTLTKDYAVMLYLHGNAGTRAAWHRVQLYKKLAHLNFHVFAFDYRGFADSTGYPSERGVVEDSLSVYHYIRTIDSDVPVYIWGHSLGTAIATLLTKELNARNLPVESLILEAPFNNIVEAASYHPVTLLFRFLPWHDWALEGLAQHDLNFASDRNIAHVRVPTLILHAEDDMVVPYSLGYKLYESAVATKRTGGVEFVTLDGRHGYGHKHIHKHPDLLKLVRKFTGI